jgi:hypothetical protein
MDGFVAWPARLVTHLGALLSATVAWALSSSAGEQQHR